MSEQTESAPAERRGNGNGDRDDALARLLHLAGPRPAIPRDVEQRVRARVQHEWSRATRRRRTLRWAAPVALAAGVLLAVFVNLGAPPAPIAAPVLGTVARINAGSDAGLPGPGSSVRRGDTLATGAGQSLSVSLAGGVSLRLAPDTALRFDAANEFALLRGELYADTGPSVYRSVSLRVLTPLATVTDIGTQFLVRYADDSLRVAVREGRVDVARDDDTHAAMAGDLLQLQPGEPPQTATVSPRDEMWRWASAVAPVFDIENRSLMDFLAWAARETGRELAFADSAQQMAAMRAVLHGSIDDFTPDEAIASVLATSGFDYRVTPERIYIGSRRGN